MRSACSSMPVASSARSTRAGRARRRGTSNSRANSITFSRPGERALGGELLRHVADEPPHGHRARAPRRGRSTVRDARRHAQQRREDADRRRLAGAVGPEQAEHLAGANARGRRRRRRGGRRTRRRGPRSGPRRDRRSRLTLQLREQALERGERRARATATSSPSSAPSAAVRRRWRSSRQRRRRRVAAGREVQPRGAAGRRGRRGARRGRAPARPPTSVLTVFGARWSAAAASRTPTPGLGLDEAQQLDLRAGQRLAADDRPRTAPQPPPDAAPGGGQVLGEELLRAWCLHRHGSEYSSVTELSRPHPLRGRRRPSRP